MKKDLTITGLLFFIIINLGVQIKESYHLDRIEKELQSTIDVVYYVSDKLDIAHEMIDSLNEEQSKMQDEIDEMKEFKRLVKELR